MMISKCKGIAATEAFYVFFFFSRIVGITLLSIAN